jgi:hypothetical protein
LGGEVSSANSLDYVVQQLIKPFTLHFAYFGEPMPNYLGYLGFNKEPQFAMLGFLVE